MHPIFMKLNYMLIGLLLSACIGLPAWAHDGHDHGGAPASPTGPALPRFASASDLFELVGVVDGKFMTLYLDRFNDNAPVPGAVFDLDVGGTKIAVKEVTPGEYEAELGNVLKPGLTAVIATVTVDGSVDILAGDLSAPEAANATTPAASTPSKYLPWALGAAALLTLLVTVLRRSITRRSRIGGAS